MRLQVALAAGAVTHVVLAAPASIQLNPRQNASTPCAIASSKAAAALAAAPSARATIEAQVAFDCLNSVPLRSNEAVQLVDAIKPYVEWQSDLAYLKEPPKDYPFKALDVFGGLDAVKANITSGTFKSEYEFQANLFQVFNSAHDGHFVFYPDALTKAFTWRRQVALVSISKDGLEIPKIYAYGDVANQTANSTFQPSAIIKINDVEASRFVQESANAAAPFQDPDAGYNSMFFQKSGQAGLGLTGFFQAGGPFNYIWPGATTKLEFENGTTTTLMNLAVVRSSLTGVTDGDKFYEKFCTGPTAAAAPVPSPTSSSISSSSPVSSTSTLASSATPAATTVPGYPAPVIVSSDFIVSGYYLNEPGAEDVAVLSVLDFAPASPEEFQTVVQKFTSGAKAAGKKKLIIDLSVNGGGFLFLGYDLFRQFFPQITQDGFTRFRQNAALLEMAKVVSNAIPASFNRSTATDEDIQNFESFYNYRFDLTIANATFPNIEAKFLGVTDKSDKFSNLIRWDMSDPLATINTTYGLGIDISGYGSRTNLTQQFAAEDIVMMYDGFCASTCTIFSEFMRLQAGVKSIAFGGRPSNTAIQGIGGVKGSQSYGWDAIYSDAQRALSIQNATQQPQSGMLKTLTDLPMNRSIASGVNLRDNVLPQNLGDGVPAQFVTEMSDCRLFWTSAMINDQKAVWNAAAKAAWGNGACVAGGFPKQAIIASQTGVSGPSRAGVVKTEVVKSSVELNKDASWDIRHGTKVTYS